MKKFLIFAFLSFIIIGSICVPKYTQPVLATNTQPLIVRAFGDSISAGYGLSEYDSVNKASPVITPDSYPQVFFEPYTNYFNTQVIRHSVSGDNSSDLLNILQPYVNGTASDLESFNNTDLVTLCIGANNILPTAVSLIPDYLSGAITDTEYRQIMAQGVYQFETDYPQILSALSHTKTVIMTVYNPYKYLSLYDVNIDPSLSGSQSIIDFILSSYQSSFLLMLNTTMEYLQQINNIIRDSASEDVFVVDIWELFEGFTKQQYLDYINADISKVTIDSLDFSTLIDDIKVNCDPHPTKAGHEAIAQKHLDEFKYFKISSNDNMFGEKKANGKFTINVSTLEDEDYKYVAYAKVGDNFTYLCESTSNTFTVNAKNLNGQGQIFVYVYNNGHMVYKTNSINYNITIVASVYNLYLIIGIAVFAVCLILIIIMWIVSKRKPKPKKVFIISDNIRNKNI